MNKCLRHHSFVVSGAFVHFAQIEFRNFVKFASTDFGTVECGRLLKFYVKTEGKC